MKGHHHYVPFPSSGLLRPLHKLSDALVHYVPIWVLLALIALLLGWIFGWTHGLGREARGFIRGLGRKGVYAVALLLVVALLLTFAFFSRTESFFRTLEFPRLAAGP
jgi:hypothetical protein